jgi:hypothetical protein
MGKIITAHVTFTDFSSVQNLGCMTRNGVPVWWKDWRHWGGGRKGYFDVMFFWPDEKLSWYSCNLLVRLHVYTWTVSILAFFFFAVLAFEPRAYTLSHSASPFCTGYFQDRVSQTICPGWLWTKILLISASWVARITDLSHQHLAEFNQDFFFFGDTVVWT